MRKFSLFVAFLMVFFMVSIAQANGRQAVATLHGTDFGQGEGGGGPLYEDGTANGNFGVSVLNGGLIFTVHMESWYYEDAEHIVACGPLTVVRDDFGFNLPDYICTTPVPISGFPVYSDFDGDGQDDHIEWVRLLHP